MNQELELAKQILEVIPPSMLQIRTDMRAAARHQLTVPQFRILIQLFRGLNQVSRLAEHQGVSQPAMSKTVEGLVQRGLILRIPQSHDRRQVRLALTKKGNTLLQKVRKAAQESLYQKITLLNSEERSQLKKGLIQLTKLFQLKVPKNFI